MNPRETQEDCLEKIIRTNESTQFGREYLFREIKDADDYKRCVPLSLYHDVKPYIQLMMAGKAHTLVAEPAYAWIETVGADGDVILFPYTESVAHTFREAFLRLFASQLEDWAYISGKILAGLGQHTWVKGASVNSVLQLGVETLKQTPFLERVMTPPLNSFKSTDIKKQWTSIAQKVSRQNIIAAVVDPVLFLMFLRQIEAEHLPRGFSAIHELWPNFSLIVSDVCMDPYRIAFRSILKNTEFRTIFCADEVVAAVQIDDKGVVPLYDQNFYEFIPLKEWKTMKEEKKSYRDYEFDVKTGETVRPGKEYVLVLTTPGGLYRYIPGDVVKMVDNLHMVKTETIECTPEKGAEPLVLLREVARDELMTDTTTSQVVAVESEPMRYVFGL
jgi:hypothetical protein